MISETRFTKVLTYTGGLLSPDESAPFLFFHLHPWWLSIASWLNWVGPNDPLKESSLARPLIVESVWLRGDHSCGKDV